MSKKQIGLCLIAVLGLLHIGATRAAVISFNPSSQTVALGNPASVDLVISGLGPDPTGFDPFLSTFDLEISFDGSILSFQSFSVGPSPTQLNPSGLDFGFSSGSGILDSSTISVFDLSFDTDETLRMVQPDTFDLGTIVFETVGTGTSALTITSAILGGETSPVATIPFEADLETGSITVSAIPVPAAAWLFATGLIGLIGFGKRRKFLMQS